MPASAPSVRRTLLAAALALALGASGAAGTAAGPDPDLGQEVPSGTPALTASTFQDPPASVRPGTRWWWDSLLAPTSEFSLQDALEEVDAFAAAGLGRLEIAWAAATYATPEQRAALRAVAERAAQRGLQLDMTLGDAWPWVTPQTEQELAQQELMYGRTDVSGPTQFSEPLPAAIGDDGPRGRLVAATAARVITAGPSVDQPGTPPASSTVLDPASLVDLTSRVVDGRVTWSVPPGDWIVFAFWQRPVVKSGHSQQPGNVVSLIDGRSVRAGLDFVQQHQVGEAGPDVQRAGHAFFEDSLETKAEELYWSTALPGEFARRRGYDLTKYLPLMFVQRVSDFPTPRREPVPDFDLPDQEGARYRFDYYSTLTDLYVDEHIEVIADWAEQYGMAFRTQPAYGNPFEVIRSARGAARAGGLVDDESLAAADSGKPDVAIVDVDKATCFDDPEDPCFHAAMEHYRLISSGSAQGGQLEVSSELGATFNQELHTSLSTFKRMMDKEWAAGVTRPLLHGVTHSPAGTPWPGASHFGGIVGESLNHRTWPQWKHLKPLADYWARGALVLQQGAARTDVAFLKDTFLGTPVDTSALNQAGFSVGYVDSQGVVESRPGARGDLFPEGPSYDALVVDTTQYYVGSGRLPAETAEAVDAASARGLKVVFVGDLPQRGLRGLEPSTEDERVRRAVQAVLARPGTAHVAEQSQVLEALATLGAQPAARWSRPAHVYTQRRQAGGTTYYYLWNATSERQRLTGSFEASGSPSQLDLWDGTIEPLALYERRESRVEVPLDLAPHETLVLAFGGVPGAHVVASTADRTSSAGKGLVTVSDDQGGPQTVRLSNGTTTRVSLPLMTDAPLAVGDLLTGRPWQLQATTYGPEGQVARPAVPLPVLADWRALPGLTAESGIGTYRATVDVPAQWTGAGRGARLDLGDAAGSVQVRVNGVLVTRDVDPHAPLEVTELLRPGFNEVQVQLATTLLNKALVTPTTALTRPVFTMPLTGTQPYGLLGPVTLVPYARGTVTLR